MEPGPSFGRPQLEVAHKNQSGIHFSRSNYLRALYFLLYQLRPTVLYLER